MAKIIAEVLFWGVFAVILAAIEIESEGKYGWAERMPTWYRTTGFWARLYGAVMSGKPLTGYHTFMFFLPALIFHSHFFMGVQWSIAGEFKTWALYFAWCPLWDYYWFVLNPSYAGKFAPEHIWWHAKSHWVCGWFPVDYLVGVALSICFAGAAAFAQGTPTPFERHLELLTGFAMYTGILRLMAPTYHRWYLRMRTTDHRTKAPIFHENHENGRV